MPPIALWDGIPVRDDDPRLIADAVGWLVARTITEVPAGDHTFFIGEVLLLEAGSAPTSLVHHDRTYSGL